MLDSSNRFEARFKVLWYAFAPQGSNQGILAENTLAKMPAFNASL